ncbi:MAG: type II toxin-antitoxin system mRNA interferase toxin, RelE/StbE family [Terriglobia bacterium]
MMRLLLRSSSFVRRAKKILKKHPHVSEELQSALELLATDCFHPRLKTHKLKGELEGSWACSAGYNLRIVFKFVEYEASEGILLLTLGTHEEVY